MFVRERKHRSLPTYAVTKAWPWRCLIAMKVVIIEGEAHVAPRSDIDKLADYFFNKYEWDFRYDDSAKWQLIEITPLKILAWGDGYRQ